MTGGVVDEDHERYICLHETRIEKGQLRLNVQHSIIRKTGASRSE